MVGLSKVESVSVRFGAYIEELREFFRSREVSFGSPADVRAFADRVAEPGSFQDEMGSMIRSILFREGETLGRGELLELVAVAVGGAEIETAAQEMHDSVRQMFVFVNGALRQRERMVPKGFSDEDAHITAGDVLAASEAQDESEGQPVGGRSPENGYYRRTAEPPNEDQGPAEDRIESRSSSSGSGMLFRAVSMAEMQPEEEATAGTGRRWMIPAAIAVLIALAVGVYLMKPAQHRASDSGAGTTNSAASLGSAGSCVSPMAPGIARSALEERSRWAHRLLSQKLYDAALPELKSVAQMDPGYPGINLDQSEALLHLHRPDDARDAIDSQINVSECLAKLPSAALDSYCNAEFSPAAAGACRPELARIRQAAQLQAAMVHLELGHRIAPDAGTEPAVADAPKEPVESPRAASAPSSAALAAPAANAHRAAPAATEGDNARPAQRAAVTPKSPVATKPGHKAEGDESLMRGEGTDSSLGAYSKPQE